MKHIGVIFLRVMLLVVVLALTWVGYLQLPQFLRYQIHDEIYLPLKGIAHFSIYPYGWLLWWTLTLVAVLFLSTWLLRIPLLLRLQALVLRGMIRVRLTRWLLLAGARFMRVFLFRPKLLLVVVEHRLNGLIIRLNEQRLGSAQKGDCQRLVDMFEMRRALHELVYGSPKEALTSIEQIHHLVWLLQAHANSKELPPLLKRLGRLDKRIEKRAERRSRGKAQTADLNTPFQPDALTHEIHLLIQAESARLAQAARHNGELRLDMLNGAYAAVMRGVEQRYAVLLTAQRAFRDRLLHDGATERLLTPIPVFDIQPNQAPIIGRMMLNIALHLSILVKDALIARRYVEVMTDLLYMGQIIDVDKDEIKPILAFLTQTSLPEEQEFYPLLHDETVQQTLAELLGAHLTVLESQLKPGTSVAHAHDYCFERNLIHLSRGQVEKIVETCSA